MEHTALRPKPMPGQEPAGAPGRRPAAATPRRGRRPVAVAYVLLTALLLLLAGIGLGTVGGTVLGLTRTAGHTPPRQPGAPGAPPTGSGPAGTAPSAPRTSSAGSGRAGAGPSTAGPLSTGPGRTGRAPSAPGAPPAGSDPAGTDSSPRSRAADPAAGVVPAPGSPAARSAQQPPRPVIGVEAVDDGGRGARVTVVRGTGPAYTAGLVRGDVLLAFAGAPVDSAADLARAVARARPGHPVTVTVQSGDGRRRRLTLTPGVVT